MELNGAKTVIEESRLKRYMRMYIYFIHLLYISIFTNTIFCIYRFVLFTVESNPLELIPYLYLKVDFFCPSLSVKLEMWLMIEYFK